MKKFLLLIFSVICLTEGQKVYAQSATFTMADTVRGFYSQSSGAQNFNDFVSTPSSNDNVILNWKVIASDFPSDWYGMVSGIAVLGICDNYNCYNNNASLTLWNPAHPTASSVYTSHRYAGANGDFHMQLDLSVASVGVHYMTVSLTDANTGYSKNTVFIINRYNTGVASVNKSDDNVMVYPNPATDNLNVVYDQADGVKTIAVYNVIGKVMSVYKPLTNNSASLNLENIPAGIYFVRLTDGQGAVIATRKFTRQ